jgi:hypothetical protein
VGWQFGLFTFTRTSFCWTLIVTVSMTGTSATFISRALHPNRRSQWDNRFWNIVQFAYSASIFSKSAVGNVYLSCLSYSPVYATLHPRNLLFSLCRSGLGFEVAPHPRFGNSVLFPLDHDISYYLAIVNSSTMLLIIRSTTLDVQTVNSSTMLLIIRSILRNPNDVAYQNC